MVGRSIDRVITVVIVCPVKMLLKHGLCVISSIYLHANETTTTTTTTSIAVRAHHSISSRCLSSITPTASSEIGMYNQSPLFILLQCRQQP